MGGGARAGDGGRTEEAEGKAALSRNFAHTADGKQARKSGGGKASGEILKKK